jgi:hypothetical protein
MKSKILIGIVLAASLAPAKETKRYQAGTLLQMESVECGVDENSGKSFVGEMVGTDSAHKKTHALLCQEYILQSDTVIYRIRPPRREASSPTAGRSSRSISHPEGQDAFARGRS